jgi:uncharacterized C2H2 Zn-finger protein
MPSPCSCAGRNPNCRYCRGSGFTLGGAKPMAKRVPRPCSCAGSNENCRYCYGSGFLADAKPLSAPDPNDQRLNVKQAAFTATDDQLHGHWSRMILDDVPRERAETPRVSRGKRKYPQIARPVSRQQTQSKPAPTSPPDPRKLKTPSSNQRANRGSTAANLTRCEICNMAVYPTHVQNHLYKAHGIGARVKKVGQTSTRANAQGTLPASAINPNEMAQCPYCPAVVRAKKYRKHLRKAHPGISGTRVNGAVSDSVSAKSGHIIKADESQSESKSYREERRLDGARDYSQVRESGRFGSHPSYDDCGDESVP